MPCGAEESQWGCLRHGIVPGSSQRCLESSSCIPTTVAVHGHITGLALGMSAGANDAAGSLALHDTAPQESPAPSHAEARAHSPHRTPSQSKLGRADSAESAASPTEAVSRPPLTPEQSREHHQVSRGSPDLSSAQQQLRGMATALERAHASDSDAEPQPSKQQVLVGSCMTCVHTSGMKLLAVMYIFQKRSHC